MNVATIDTSDYVSPEQFAEAVNLPADTVRVYCLTGRIEAEKFFHRWIIRKEELKRFKRDRQPPGRPKKS